MNLVQATLAGKISSDLDAIVLIHRELSESYVRDVVEGSIAYFGGLAPSINWRIEPLSRGTANLRVARLVRTSSKDYPKAESLVVGMYPSGLWGRFKPLGLHSKMFVLEDGAASLTFDVNRLTDDGTSLGRGKAYTTLLRTVAGRGHPLRNRTTLYTCFPDVPVSNDVERHRYLELNTAMARRPPTTAPAPNLVYVDSNFSRVGRGVHFSLVRAIHEAHGFESYIPHRRMPRTEAEELARDLGVEVVRPTLPFEAWIPAWSRAGTDFLIPPSSLAYTARLFAVSSAQVTVVGVSAWLERAAERLTSGLARNCAEAAEMARPIEAWTSNRPDMAFRALAE
jgi:hypothetical protein